MNNYTVDGGAIFPYASISSTTSISSSPADVVNVNSNSSYLSLNMVNNNNHEQGLTTDKEGREDASTSAGEHFVADHGVGTANYNTGGGKINNNIVKLVGEKKIKKQPKHAFQTRSQVDILDDGYRWRKYGQKAVKNNKYPRNYYRCTHQGCNVKKQVQRLSNDDGVVVTTYEGVHSHPIDKSTDNFENILTQMQIYSR